MLDSSHLRRHTLVWLSLRCPPAAVLSAPADEPTRAELAVWMAAGRPFVVRQQVVLQRCALGMPLPPAQGKRRVALEVEPRWIARWAPPPMLDEVRDRLREPWRTHLQGLGDALPPVKSPVRVYGSCAWEALTGMTYLTTGSDLDLLWEPASQGELDRVLAVVVDWDRGGGMRADGELLFLDESGAALGVSWREWVHAGRAFGGSSQVLVKTSWGARLSAVDELGALLARRAGDLQWRGRCLNTL